MAKIIFVLIVIAAAIIWLRRSVRDAFPREQRDQHDQKPRELQVAESMVPCALCGVYLPASESISGAEEKQYCCPAHRQQAERQSQP